MFVLSKLAGFTKHMFPGPLSLQTLPGILPVVLGLRVASPAEWFGVRSLTNLQRPSRKGSIDAQLWFRPYKVSAFLRVG